MQDTARFRLVLPSTAAMGRLDGLAAAEKWACVERRTASATHAALQVWDVPPLSTRLFRVEDRFLGLTWLQIEGNGADALAQRLARALDASDLSTTLHALDAPDVPDAQRAVLLCRLGVLCVEEDSQVVNLIADTLQSAGEPARAAALEVMAALGWPALRPLVNAMLIVESSPALKARALQVAQAFGMHGGPHDESPR